MYVTRTERICKWTLLALILLCCTGLRLLGYEGLSSWNPFLIWLSIFSLPVTFGLPIPMYISLGLLFVVGMSLGGWTLLYFGNRVGAVLLLILFIPSLVFGLIAFLVSFIAMFLAESFLSALATVVCYLVMFAISGGAVLLQHKWKDEII